jgi:hypothetical protein
MSGMLLYSTNTFLKFIIQQRFRHDIHWVWCSENFDSKKAPSYSDASLVAPSSNPLDIYHELRRDVAGRDSHSAKITSQKASLQSLAVEWHAKGEINADQKGEILFMVNTASFVMRNTNPRLAFSVTLSSSPNRYPLYARRPKHSWLAERIKKDEV